MGTQQMVASTENGHVEAQPAPVVERKRGPGGRFAPGNPTGFDKAIDDFAAAQDFGKERRDSLMSLAAPAKTEQPPPSAEKPVESVKPEPPKVESAAVKAAKEALKRAKVPQTDLDSIKSDEDLPRWQGIVELVKNGDSVSRELGELRQRAKESAEKPKESVKAEEPVDFSKELQPLDLTLDEDGKKAVVSVLTKVRESAKAEIAAMKAEMKQALDEMRPEIEQSRAARLNQVLEETTAGLSKRFSQLGDKDYVKSTLLPEMAEINAERKDGTRRYSDPKELVLAACRSLGLQEASESPAPPKVPRQARAATPITETAKPPTGPMTWDKAFDQSYSLLESGKSVNEVRRELRR